MWKAVGWVLVFAVLIGFAWNGHQKKVEAEDQLQVAYANAGSALSKVQALEDRVEELESRLDEHHID